MDRHINAHREEDSGILNLAWYINMAFERNAFSVSNQQHPVSTGSFLYQLSNQAIISKKLIFFTPFLAVGYSTANANVATIGNYPVTTGATLLGQPTYTTFPNPISIKETTVKGARADLGFQLELAFFRFYASYSAAKYQSFSGGFGFGF